MRFVILEHDHPVLHWDLMLEAGDVLQTWRLAQPPDAGCRIDATVLPDHRRMYLEYEGPVSGNRGTVRRWDAGLVEEMTGSPESRRFTFLGTRVKGCIELDHVAGDRWRWHWVSEGGTLAP